VQPYSVVGILNLDGAGNFTVSEYVYTANGAPALNGSGTYTVNANCSLSLAFAAQPFGTPSVVVPPSSFSILLGAATATSGTTGLVSIQPTTGQVLSGVLISQ